MANRKLYQAYKNAFGVEKQPLTDEQLAAAVAASRSGSFKDRLRAQGYGDTLDRGAKLQAADKGLPMGKNMQEDKAVWGRGDMTGDDYRRRAAFFTEPEPFKPQGQGDVTQSGSTRKGQYNNGGDAGAVRNAGSNNTYYDNGADAIANVDNYNKPNYTANGAAIKNDDNTYNGKMRDGYKDQADAEMLAKDNQAYGVDPEALAAAGTGLYAFGHNWNRIEPSYRAITGNAPKQLGYTPKMLNMGKSVATTSTLPAALSYAPVAGSGLFGTAGLVAVPAAALGAGIYGADANVRRIQDELNDDPFYTLE